jgi:hypothetical protein
MVVFSSLERPSHPDFDDPDHHFSMMQIVNIAP